MTYTGPATSVWISPHADDETLSMGAGIIEHIDANGPHSVAVILATTGESSGARRVLREAGYVPPGLHDIQRHALTRREFVASRDAEFYQACRELGILHDHIYMPGFTITEDDGTVWNRPSYTTASIPRLARFSDGAALAVQAPRIRGFVNAVVGWFGTRHYKTMSWADPSQDHRLVGEALRDCPLPTASRRFYYPPYRMRDMPAGAPQMTVKLAPSRAQPTLAGAGRAYGHWSPAQGRYAVGWLSVGANFGGPAAELLRCPTRVPPATDPSECGRVGEVRAPETPLFGVGRTLVHT